MLVKHHTVVFSSYWISCFCKTQLYGQLQLMNENAQNEIAGVHQCACAQPTYGICIDLVEAFTTNIGTSWFLACNNAGNKRRLRFEVVTKTSDVWNRFNLLFSFILIYLRCHDLLPASTMADVFTNVFQIAKFVLFAVCLLVFVSANCR